MKNIGKYTVLKQLGSGSFGAVYLAEDTILNEQVAVKVFQIKDKAKAGLIVSASADPVETLKQRFIEEARILRNLPAHPNIISLHEVNYLEDGTPYYVMPYIPKTLIDELAKTNSAGPN